MIIDIIKLIIAYAIMFIIVCKCTSNLFKDNDNEK